MAARRVKTAILMVGGVLAVAAAVVVGRLVVEHSRRTADPPLPASITIDYPEDDSIFPPEITAPTFLWHDASQTAAVWRIDVTFGDGSAGLHVESRGPRPQIGEIDPRCVAKTNEPPKLTPQQAAARTWTPDAETWETIKSHSVAGPATVTITGCREGERLEPVSRGRVTLQTSKDPVGGPIFYRDVPLAPSQTQKGIIKPLPEDLLPLVAWRLRNIAEPRSRLLLERMPVCANCHSFSRDGKTLGLDMDGPENDKGLYTLVSVAPTTTIRNSDVIKWNPRPPQPAEQKAGGATRVGFLSQVSPDGQYVVTTLNTELYLVNFTDYRFLQVFYPTRGILAWYDRATGRKQPLPGADDPRYVQTSAFWSPDGTYLVFCRAEARDAYPPGRKLAERANDPNELPIQYDLCRIPFNGGKGGRAEPIAGASQNGMSNTFPKVSPDGRWIVFVECRNGLLMRPDSQLYIVPAEGGQARRMRCNTPLMNSWHSFSPSGRWLVFSSKSRSPYTQMFLTHIDEQGCDSPAILIDNATAANRAVNIPEFVNIPPEGLMKIDVPAAERFRLLERGRDLAKQGEYEPAIADYEKALEIEPDYAEAHNSLGNALVHRGQADDGIGHYRKALEIKPDYAEAYYNLGLALAGRGQADEATADYRKALEFKPDYVEAYSNLGNLLLDRGQAEEAIADYRKALAIKPDSVEVHYNLGIALAGRGRRDEALEHYQKALDLATARNDKALADLIRARIRQHQSAGK